MRVAVGKYLEVRWKGVRLKNIPRHRLAGPVRYRSRCPLGVALISKVGAKVATCSVGFGIWEFGNFVYQALLWILCILWNFEYIYLFIYFRFVRVSGIFWRGTGHGTWSSGRKTGGRGEKTKLGRTVNNHEWGASFFERGILNTGEEGWREKGSRHARNKTPTNFRKQGEVGGWCAGLVRCSKKRKSDMMAATKQNAQNT